MMITCHSPKASNRNTRDVQVKNGLNEEDEKMEIVKVLKEMK